MERRSIWFFSSRSRGVPGWWRPQNPSGLHEAAKRWQKIRFCRASGEDFSAPGQASSGASGEDFSTLGYASSIPPGGGESSAQFAGTDEFLSTEQARKAKENSRLEAEAPQPEVVDTGGAACTPGSSAC